MRGVAATMVALTFGARPGRSWWLRVRRTGLVVRPRIVSGRRWAVGQGSAVGFQGGTGLMLPAGPSAGFSAAGTPFPSFVAEPLPALHFSAPGTAHALSLVQGFRLASEVKFSLR